MKDTEAWAAVVKGEPVLATLSTTRPNIDARAELSAQPVVVVSRERYFALAALEKQWAGADDDTMWQAMFGEDGQLVIPPGWAQVNCPVAKGDRVLVQGSFAKWWTKASRDPECDASAYEIVIRKKD